MDSSLRGWRDWRRVLLFFGSRAAYPGHSNLACSRRSDRGDGAKRCEQKKNTLFFSRSLPSRRTPLSKRLERATTISLATHANGWRYLTSEPSAPGDKWILRVKCSAFRAKKVLSLYCRSGSSIIVCTEIETACFQYMLPIYLLHTRCKWPGNWTHAAGNKKHRRSSPNIWVPPSPAPRNRVYLELVYCLLLIFPRWKARCGPRRLVDYFLRVCNHTDLKIKVGGN